MGGSYPDSPGWKRRETSEAAAAAMAPRAGTIRERVLSALRENPGTADEIAERIGEHFLSCRPRCSELAAKFLIADSGIRRPNVGGKSAIVWQAISEPLASSPGEQRAEPEAGSAR
jgi:hypothetical protein